MFYRIRLMSDLSPRAAGADAGSASPPMTEVEVSLADVLTWSLEAGTDPLMLNLSGAQGNQVLRLTERLRVLPGRRLVCVGRLGPDDQQVVVKWFFGADALRYAERERQGFTAMQRAAVPAPELLASWRVPAMADTDGACVLVFTYLADAQELSDELLEHQPELWVALWKLLAQLNLAGVVHNDLHFSNLLCLSDQGAAPRLWLIDGDAVTQLRNGPVAESTGLHAFAQLAAQARQTMSSAELQTHWAHYCRACNWPVERLGRSALQSSYAKARRARVVHFQAKTRRTCSAFALRRTLLGQALVDRGWLGDTPQTPQPDSVRELLSWLDGLPDLFVGEAGPDAPRDVELLKAGNTATVIRASWLGRELVIKRYNNKSVWHRLRRLLRANRGLNSWVYAHTLRFVGIPTAHAVALLRTRLGGPTYLVMEAHAGVELDATLLDGNEDLCQRLVAVLERLGAEGLVHNDTKASNFLWDATSLQLAVIDLDAMRMPARVSARLSGQKRDRRRLLRNFAATPELQRRFRGTLGL